MPRGCSQADQPLVVKAGKHRAGGGGRKPVWVLLSASSALPAPGGWWGFQHSPGPEKAAQEDVPAAIKPGQTHT